VGADVAQDAVDDGGLGDDGEDVQRVAAARAEERVGLVGCFTLHLLPRFAVHVVKQGRLRPAIC
jgi:hypothetical protein